MKRVLVALFVGVLSLMIVSIVWAQQAAVPDYSFLVKKWVGVWRNPIYGCGEYVLDVKKVNGRKVTAKIDVDHKTNPAVRQPVTGLIEDGELTFFRYAGSAYVKYNLKLNEEQLSGTAVGRASSDIILMPSDSPNIPTC